MNNKKFDAEKNKKRNEYFLGKNSHNMSTMYNPLKNNKNIVGDIIDGTNDVQYIFISSNNKFVEFDDVAGKYKSRKGLTICYISNMKSGNIYSVGFAVCGEGDVFDVQKGYKLALLDAVYSVYNRVFENLEKERSDYITKLMESFKKDPPKESSMDGFGSLVVSLYFGQK